METQTQSQEQTQSQSQDVEVYNELRTVLRKNANCGNLLYKVDRYLTIYPAFQLRTTGYVYKVQVLNHTYLEPINCAKYVSKSGLTFSYCKAKSAEWKEVSGLWIINRNFRKMTMKSNRKLWRNMNEVKHDWVPDWANLIFVTNYGYEAYERAVKAPTISLPVIYQNGNGIEIYDFTQYISQITHVLPYEPFVNTPKKLTSLVNLVNFDRPVIGVELLILQRTSLRSHLVIVPEDTIAKVNGNGNEIKLRTGAYIVLHQS